LRWAAPIKYRRWPRLTQLFTFDRIRLGAFGPRGYLDEIRIGTTSQDVGFAIPEPSTYALLGLGAFAMAGVRRRQQKA